MCKVIDFRRLIGFGKASFVISLPKEWVTKHKLKKGDFVYLTKKDHSLILAPHKSSEKKELRKETILTNGKEGDLVELEIISAYLNNFDILSLKGSNLELLEPKIKTVLQELIGVEILEQDSSRMLIKNLLDINQISINAVIRRIDILLRNMLEDCIKLPHEDFNESVYIRDKDVNKLVLLAKRSIRCALNDEMVAKKIGLENVKLFKAWQLVHNLELVGDEIKRIKKHMMQIEMRKQNKKNLKKIHENLQKSYLDAMKAHHTSDTLLAHKIDLETKKRVSDCSKHIKSNDEVYAKLFERTKIFNAVMRDIARTIVQ